MTPAEIGAKLRKKVALVITLTVLAGCLALTTVVVYAAFHAEDLGERLSNSKSITGTGPKE